MGLQLAGLLLTVLVGWGIACAQAPLGEYDVKAAYLFKFGNYIRWPQGTPQGQYVVGVLGDAPADKVLEAFRDAKVQGMPAAHARFASLDDYRPCHLLFIAGQDEQAKSRIADAAKRLQGRPVVIVGETPGALDSGATINLLRIDETVKFEVNVAAAAKLNVVFDARLLRIAHSVRK